MTSQDTKLPWKFSGGDIVDAGGVPWVLDTDEDIAAFIVRAVNHHEELVGALRECICYVARYEADHESNVALNLYTKSSELLAALDADNA